jgi:hypothetical protein
MSLISGPKVAELPSPISPWASANWVMLPAAAERRKPAPSASAPQAHHHAAETEADHGEGEGQRCLAARHAEARLHGRQRHHERPHADAADGAERQRRREPQPRIGRLDLGARAYARGVRMHVHGPVPE